jgi:hypothetical protein
MKALPYIQVILFALTIGFGVLAYNLFTFKQAQVKIDAQQDSVAVEIMTYAQVVSSETRLVREHSAVLAKSVLYLDSCQQAKTIKQDRAERRGKFVGGLLKGLFPGL